MYNNNHPMHGQNDIRPTGKGPVVSPISESMVPEHVTVHHPKLGRSEMNCGHFVMALILGVIV